MRSSAKPQGNGQRGELEPIKHFSLVRTAYLLLFHIINPIVALLCAFASIPAAIVALIAKCSSGSNACAGLSHTLAGFDIGLANFVGRHCLSFTRMMVVDPHIQDSRSLAVFGYMLSAKLISAEISLFALVLTQALPVYVMMSKGDDFGGYLGDSFNFDDKPVVYAIVVFVAYSLGWAMVMLGAPLSVKLTRKFCAQSETQTEPSRLV